MLTAIETTGTVTEQHQLVLDESLPFNTNERVRVIVLAQNETNEQALLPQFRQAGSAAGKIQIAADFDAPLEDFRDYLP